MTQKATGPCHVASVRAFRQSANRIARSTDWSSRLNTQTDASTRGAMWFFNRRTKLAPRCSRLWNEKKTPTTHSLTQCRDLCHVLLYTSIYSGAARGEGESFPLWVDVQKLCNMCVFIVMELLRITRQIHCKAVEQRATLIHRQYNWDWGTSYSRPPIDPYLTSPLLQNPGGAIEHIGLHACV